MADHFAVVVALGDLGTCAVPYAVEDIPAYSYLQPFAFGCRDCGH